MPRQVNGEREISYKIVEHIGIIGVYQTKWQKELNLVNWNGTNPKYDIRDWDSNHQKMSRGITLHKDEARKLYLILKEHFEHQEQTAAASEKRMDTSPEEKKESLSEEQKNFLPEEKVNSLPEEKVNSLPEEKQFASIENPQENVF